MRVSRRRRMGLLADARRDWYGVAVEPRLYPWLLCHSHFAVVALAAPRAGTRARTEHRLARLKFASCSRSCANCRRPVLCASTRCVVDSPLGWRNRLAAVRLVHVSVGASVYRVLVVRNTTARND